MSYLKGIAWLIKQTLIMWKEVIKVMKYVYTFKSTDTLVKSQVTMFLLGLYTTIEDVPPLYNLRDAVLEAMGMTYEDFEMEEPVEEVEKEPEE